MMPISSCSASRPHGRSPAARAAGLSLVELMVAMAISMLLLAGVIAIFASSRSSYETTDRVSRIQEVGRFALDQITRDLRAAGFVGCAREPTYVSTSLNAATTGDVRFDFLDAPVRGYEAIGANSWSPALPAVILQPASGNDVLLLRGPRGGVEPLRLTASMTSGTDALTVPNVTTGVQAGDVALAYSCEAQAYFHVTAFAGGAIEHGILGTAPGNGVDSISYAFRTNAEVVPVHTVIYFIRQGASGVPALWRQAGTAAAEELAEGVERMELEFGEDTSGVQYRTANAVTNWNNVRSVRVALLVRSLDAYGTDTDQRTYQLLGVTVAAPGDRLMREVFTTTASVRNRIPVN